jgi:hypothetical protein
MVVSDLRKRNIKVIWLTAFYAATYISSIAVSGWMTALLNAACNIIFLALLFGFLYVYVGIVRKNRYGSFSRAIGTGDILFLPALAPLCDVVQFAGFLICSFALTLLGWGVLRLLGRAPKTIPLVSTVGMCFIIYALILFV